MTNTCQKKLHKLRNVFDADERHMLAISMATRGENLTSGNQITFPSNWTECVDFPNQNLVGILNGRGKRNIERIDTVTTSTTSERGIESSA